MKYGKTLTSATILTALLATAPVSAPAQSKTEAAKDKVKGVTQDVKTTVSDSWITSKTKIALFSDDRVKGRQVNVDTKDGVVHLKGHVDSAEAKTAAGEVARGIEGVRSVQNDLMVGAPAPALDQREIDAGGQDADG